MPAFQLARLKAQIGELIRLFTRPAEFHRELTDMLEFYADHGYRAGEEVQSLSLVSAYRVPPLVMRNLEVSVSEMNRENPHAGLALVEELWKDLYSEPRHLAATLLGKMPPDLKEDVAGRLKSWARPGLQEQYLDLLIVFGGIRLRHEDDRAWLCLLEEWLTDKDPETQKIGLRAAVLTIQDNKYKNIPPLFKLITPPLLECADQLKGSILEVLESLVIRTPSETAYFIRQMATNSNTSAETMKLLRQCLSFFSAEDRSLLRDAFQLSGS